MGSNNSQANTKQITDDEKIRHMQIYLKYNNDRKISKMLYMRHLCEQQQKSTSPDEADSCTFGCYGSRRSSKKKQKEKFTILEWTKILLKTCEEYKDDYQWASIIQKKVKKCLDQKRFSYQYQKQDQNQIIWALATMFNIDMQTNFNRNQEEFNLDDDDDDDDDEEEEEEKCYQNNGQQQDLGINGLEEENKENDNSNQQVGSSEGLNIKKKQGSKDDNKNEEMIVSVLRNTELFIEDLESTLENSKHKVKNNNKISQIGNNNGGENNSSQTKSLEIQIEEDEDDDEDDDFYYYDEEKDGFKIKQELDKKRNQKVIKYQQEQKDRLNNLIEKSKIQNGQQPKLQKAQTSSFSSGGGIRKKNLTYSNNTVIINQQYLNTQQTKKQQVKMVKMVGFYKKATEFFELQFGDKSHIFYYLIKEFRKQFLRYYHEIFNELQLSKESPKHQSTLRKHNLSQIQKLKLSKNYSNKNNFHMSLHSQKNQESFISVNASEIQLDENDQLDFKDYYDLAVDEIKDFITMMCEVIISYYNIEFLQCHRYGKLLGNDNLHNFLISYIFDNKIHSLMMQYCSKINREKELDYGKKLKIFESVSPDQLGIRKELQDISSQYNYFRKQKSLKNVNNILPRQMAVSLPANNYFIQQNQPNSYDDQYKSLPRLNKSNAISNQYQSPSKLKVPQGGAIELCDSPSKRLEEFNNDDMLQQNNNKGNQTMQRQEDSMVYKDIIKLFSLIPTISSPIHKLKIIVRCNEMIVQEIEKIREITSQLESETSASTKNKKINLDGDDILNAYIYICGKSGVVNLFSQLQLIDDFMNQTQKNGHTAYFFTTVYSAAFYLKDFSRDKLKHQ